SDLPHGVSFASAATGYDDFTANISSVLAVSKTARVFKHYKIHLRELVGAERAEFIVRNALYIVSMGTNDFLQNYFLDPTRPNQFSMPQFQNFLLSRFSHAIEAMHRLGANRIVVVGVPPMGCIPLMKALQNKKNCVASLNKIAYSFNARLLRQLATLKAKLGIKTAYVDVYNSMLNAVLDPKKTRLVLGFEEGSKGCCGTGTVEYGESCRGMETCSDPTKYVFWDAVHPTEMMYNVVAGAAIHSVARELTS
ncbi:GDSL esterase/lipase At5g45950-like, partial [Neltuma alba]|uniref:GDSL esterase/lipase At5g45950-like n=1 Tax=Neltuma alba TaxID=207710 RepID=UPI0010A520B9